MSCRFTRQNLLRFFLFLLLTPSYALPANDEPKWMRVNSAHFSVLTNAGEKKGTQAALRLEQMRAVCGQLLLKKKLHMPRPVDVIAFRAYSEYAQLTPLQQGQPVSAQAFFLPGTDRNYIVLNMADDESWSGVQHAFGHMLLDYNYPPTQPWFDEGFAEYFSSLRLDDRQAQIGADPGGFIPILKAQPWLPIASLFTTGHEVTSQQEASRHSQFYAESWIVMHYLLHENKLPETGTYFDLVQNQKLPAEQAIQRAFGVSAAQFEQAVKDYFQRTTAAQSSARPQGTALPAGANQFTPVGANEIGSSVTQVPPAQVRALIAEAMLRPPEHREEALRQLNALVAEPLTETATAYRALAWVHLEKHEFDDANEELSKALELEANDPWTHYYLARMKYEIAQSKGSMFPGLANMMQDLRIVLDWNLDFAEAYHMLAMARVEGGGMSSAIESIQAAVQLDPRNESYVLDMARVYIAAKKWDTAAGLLDHLKSSPNQQIAAAARQNLTDLPTLKKYGLLPQHGAATPPPKAPVQKLEAEGTETEPQPVLHPAPDKRKVQFLKGKLVGVDCSASPAAVLTVSAGGKTLRLRTQDYKSLLLIGEDNFSCDWRNRPVFVNYKAGGKSDGDLVSVELQ